MLATPEQAAPSFGVVMNGSEFLFLKLVRAETPQYATSNLFSMLNRENDLYQVLSVLKRLRNTVKNEL